MSFIPGEIEYLRRVIPNDDEFFMVMLARRRPTIFSAIQIGTRDELNQLLMKATNIPNEEIQQILLYADAKGNLISSQLRMETITQKKVKKNRSQGERHIIGILFDLKISYIPEYPIAALRDAYYDFHIIYENVKFIIEHDGIQHFIETSFFKGTLAEQQQRDIRKTLAAVESGYHVIRIDDMSMNSALFIIKAALEKKAEVFLSSKDKYGWLIEHLKNKKVEFFTSPFAPASTLPKFAQEGPRQGDTNFPAQSEAQLPLADVNPTVEHPTLDVQWPRSFQLHQY